MGDQVVSKYLAKIVAYVRNQRGNVAVIFALSIIPIISIVGFNIDLQKLSVRKNDVQHAIDAAVLKGARDIQLGKKPDDVTKLMQKSLADQVALSPGLTCGTAIIKYANRNRDIDAEVTCTIKTLTGGFMGPEKTAFTVEATSTWDVGQLDVAFMFDISGSMDQSNRLNDLKDAANDAIDTLLPDSETQANEGVRIAMVAYDDAVNAGTYFEKVTGLAKRRTYYATDTYRDERVVRREKYTKRVCTTTGNVCQRYDSDGRCTKWGGGKQTCRNEDAWRDIKEFYGPYKTRTISKTIDSTCVWERHGKEAFTDAAPTYKPSGAVAILGAKDKIYNAVTRQYSGSETFENKYGFMAAGHAWFSNDNRDTKQGMSSSIPGCSGIQPLALTNDRKALTKYIRDLKTRGGTAGHQGIAWAWYLISEHWGDIFPGESKPLGYNQPMAGKALILMSDGHFAHQFFTSEQGTSDQQARKLCDAIKKQGDAMIFTVAFKAPEAGEDTLKYCASDPTKAFTADDALELKEAYNAIAGSLSELRIKN